MFGRLITAMVTPFAADESVNLDEARRLAAYLVDKQKNDSLVINGTTGESPTTSDTEKAELVAAAKTEVGDRAKIIAGVGTFSTEHTCKLAKEAQAAGADGLLVVTPYYSRPPQDAVVEHFLTVADATDLPIIIYDIPHRSGIPVETAALLELAKHPNIFGVKDAKGQPVASSQVMAETDLVYYAGDDAMTLPLMAVGAAGVVGTSTHFTGARTAQMMADFAVGRVDEAVEAHRQLLSVYTGVFATQGCMLVKAGLNARGFNVGGLRRPLKPASVAQTATFVSLLDAAGL